MLSYEQAREHARRNGFNPDDVNVNAITGEITQKQKTQPTMSPAAMPTTAASTEQTTKLEAFGRNAALGVIPNAAAFVPSLAAGAAVTAKLSPLFAGGPATGWIPPVAGIGAGLLTGLGVSTAASALQKKVLEQTDTGKEFLERTALSREEHPIVSAVGDVAASLPTARPNFKMLKDAAHALGSEARMGAGLANKMMNPAVQNIAISGGLGGASSVAEDLMNDQQVNVPKALVNTVLQGVVSDVAPGIASKLKIAEATRYKGQPLAEIAPSAFGTRDVERTAQVSAPASAADAPALEVKLAENRAEQQRLAQLLAENKQQKADAVVAQIETETAQLKKAADLLEKQLHGETRTYTERVATPEAEEFVRAKAAEKGVSEVEFEDTGRLTKKSGAHYGEFTPEKIKASTYAGSSEGKTNVPEGIADAFTTGAHETIHGEVYNILNSTRKQQRGIGEKLMSATEASPEFKAAKVEDVDLTPEEFLTIESARRIARDPQNAGRSFARERKATSNLLAGKASFDDVLEVITTKWRYDQNTAAPRATGAMPKNATPLMDATLREEERLRERPVAEQLELPMAKEGNALTRWLRDNDPKFDTSEQRRPGVKFSTPKGETVLEWALDAQRAAGWDTKWPFIPADLLNSDFRKMIKEDPTISSSEKDRIFEAGRNLSVVPPKFSTPTQEGPDIFAGIERDLSGRMAFGKKHPELASVDKDGKVTFHTNPSLWSNAERADWFGVAPRTMRQVTNKLVESGEGMPDWKRIIENDEYLPKQYPETEVVAGERRAKRDFQRQADVQRERPLNVGIVPPDAEGVQAEYDSLITAGVRDGLMPKPSSRQGVRRERTEGVANARGEDTYIRDMEGRVRNELELEGLNLKNLQGEDLKKQVYTNASRRAQQLMNADLRELRQQSGLKGGSIDKTTATGLTVGDTVSSSSRTLASAINEAGKRADTSKDDALIAAVQRRLAERDANKKAIDIGETPTAVAKSRSATSQRALIERAWDHTLDEFEFGRLDEGDVLANAEKVTLMLRELGVPMPEIKAYVNKGLADYGVTSGGSATRYSTPTSDDELFTTSLNKELKAARPFGLQLGKDGKLLSAEVIGKLKTLPPAEQELLRVAGLNDILAVRSRMSAGELAEWLKESGPKVEVRSYGAEGKVSEAAKELGRMQHEWLDNVEPQERAELQSYIRYGNEEYLVGSKTEDIANAKKMRELEKQVKNEPVDTSKMTGQQVGAYKHVSPKSTEEPMPEWTTSAREANKPLDENAQYTHSKVQRVNELLKDAQVKAAVDKMLQKQDAASGLEYGRGSGYDAASNAVRTGTKAAATRAEQELTKLLQSKGVSDVTTGTMRAVVKREGRYTDYAEPKNNAPKNVQRVDVVVPDKNAVKHEDKGWAQLGGYEGAKWNPDSLHEQHPNTIGWAAIQYETGPNGEKIAHIFEVQSRWGQTVRNAKQNPAEATGYERMAKDHPLLRDYNRLILKTAIEQARKEGATHIVVSDAETAMMSEGHDKHPGSVTWEGSKPESEWRPEQEPGMRLNYDKILPTIASELTGSKGERVSLGEHKNAYQKQSGVKPRQNLIFRNPDGSPKTDVSGLMFDISAPAARRAEGEQMTIAGKRYSTPTGDDTPSTTRQDRTKQGPIEKLAPQFRQVAKYDADVAEAFEKTETIREMNEAAYRNVPIAEMHKKFGRMSDLDLNNAGDYALEKFYNPDEDLSSKYTRRQREMGDLWNTLVSWPVREHQRRLDLKVETADGMRRTAKLSESYLPQMLNDKTIDVFTKATDQREVSRLRDLWIDHIVARSADTDTPVARKDAEAEISAFISALGQHGAHSADFGALRKSAGYGLPREMRELNLLRIMHRYGTRVSRDLAKVEGLEINPHVRKQLRLENPSTGEVDTSGGELLAHEEVRGAMKFITGDFEVNRSPRMLATVRVVTNGILGPMTGVHDTVATIANVAPYLKAKDLLKPVTALAEIRDAYDRSLKVGARSGAHPLDRMDVNLGTDTYVNTANIVAEGLRKWSGRDALEQFNRAWTFSIGRAVAIEAIAKNDKAFLKKFGAAANQGSEAEPKWNPDIIAKNFTDRAQGTYGGRGLPAFAVESGVAPWFALARWSMEKANVTWNDVLKPAYTGKDFKPLLAYTLASWLTGEAIDKLNEELQAGKKAQHASWKEIEAADASKEQYAFRLANVMHLGGFLGMTGDMAKIGADLLQGEKPRGYTVPLADLISDGVIGSITNFSRAVKDGADPIDAVQNLLVALSKQQLQAYRTANYWMDKEEVERKNKFRDLRVFNKLTGREVPSDVPESNPAFRADEREFKRAATEDDAVKAFDRVTARFERQFANDPEGLKKALRRLKQNSYQTFPNPDRDMVAASDYYDYLVRAFGESEAQRRLEDYVQQNKLNRMKSAAIPSLSTTRP